MNTETQLLTTIIVIEAVTSSSIYKTVELTPSNKQDNGANVTSLFPLNLVTTSGWKINAHPDCDWLLKLSLNKSSWGFQTGIE